MSGTSWQRFLNGPGTALVLTGLVLLSVAWPIHQAEWVKNMPPLGLLALVALGLALWRAGTTGWAAIRSHLMAAGVGVVLILALAVGMTPGQGVIGRWANLIDELSFWFSAVGTDELRAGSVEFAILLLAVFWIMGYVGGWVVLKRRQPWMVVVLGAVVISAALLNLTGGVTFYFLSFVGVSLLLVVHLNALRRQDAWVRRRLDYQAMFGLSHLGFILGFGIIVIGAVSVFPVPNQAPLKALADRVEPPTQWLGSEFGRLFSALPSRRAYTTLTYGDQTRLRGAFEPNDELLFTVQGDQPRYWRARVYGTYTGAGWDGGESQEAALGFGPPDLVTDRMGLEHRFEILGGTDTLLAGGEPVSFDVPAVSSTRVEVPWDVLQVHPAKGREYFPVWLYLNYSAVASVSTASPEKLRRASPAISMRGGDLGGLSSGTLKEELLEDIQASEAYPLWVSETYLQLPDELPEMVFLAAQSAAEGQLNTYDQAVAIQEYLKGFPYNLNIAGPPPGGVDGVEYFLTHLQEGYCDYYATSMAVLLRAVGIPSRYVLGYASGEFNEADQHYEVRALNYHSWVEAYFPGYGWVAFEPTPPNAIEFGGEFEVTDLESLGDLFPQTEGSPLPEDFFALEPSPNGGTIGRGLVAILPAIFAIVLVLLVVAVWYRLWGRLWRLGPGLGPYAKMRQLASWAGLGPEPQHTPQEYAAFLSAQLPSLVWAVSAIAMAYNRSAYDRRQPLSGDEAKAAIRAWQTLRWTLLRHLLGRRWHHASQAPN
jgi:transglutaminase-like putative cysteine protease